MAITFLIPMVGKWNKNQVKAETLKLYYIYLFIFEPIFLWLQYSYIRLPKLCFCVRNTNHDHAVLHENIFIIL